MAGRVTSPVFVGRRHELALLERALGDAGRSVLVLVGGEAGAGKSRLVAEFTTGATAAGARVLTGACVALGAESLPYAPFMGALGQLSTAAGPQALEALAGPGRVELARLVPELRRPGDDNRPAGPADRSVLFEVVARTLDALGAQGPLVVVIEDLHWADTSSRELLAFLAGRLRGGVLLIGTYRSDEIHRTHPLRPLLAHAARSERVVRVELAPLTPEEVALQLEAIAGSTVPAHVVEAVVARAEGNPLFAEELLAAGGGAELPPDLAEILSARLSTLPTAAQELVRVSAVAGRRVGHDLLAAAVAGSQADITLGLRDAISHNVLVADADGAYAFRHALLAEAAYAELLPAERTVLHGAYAGALDAHPEWATTRAGAAGELAHHWLLARDPAKALEASVAAATTAAETFAFAEAHGLYEQALELWEEVADARDPAKCDRAQLLQRAADAAVLAGAVTRAITLLRAALEDLDARTDHSRAAMLHERLARLLSEIGQTEASLAASRAAVALMPTEPSAERAQVIGGEARTLMLAGRYRESCTRAEAAIEVARAAGARREEGYALNTLGSSLGRLGERERAVALLEEALAIAEAVGSIEDIRRGYQNLTATLDDAVGDPGRAAAIGIEGAARLQRLSYEDGANLLRATASNQLATSGSWDEADALARAVIAANPGNQASWQARLAAGTVALRRGDFASARVHLEDARRQWAASTYIDYRAMVGVALAELALTEGLVEEARGVVDETLEVLQDSDAHDFVRQLVVLGLRAEADARTGSGRSRSSRADHSVVRAETLIARARLTRTTPGEVLPPTGQGHALRAVCEAEWARVQGRHEPSTWAEAVKAWGVSYPYEATYALFREAEALFATGARDQGIPSLRRSFLGATRLGAAPLLGQIEALARRARIRLGAAVASKRPAASTGEMPLTTREAEVLALIAAGHTNRQIADTLFMSEKTASVHVSRILTKLGVTNRAQAAALAHRRQLVDVEEASARRSPPA